MALSPLNRAFNVAVLHVTSRLFPAGFDARPAAPDTFPALKAQAASGRMVVWNGASDRTIFGDPEVNYAFRAWHDWCHVAGNHDFSPEGEAAACAMQQAHVRTLFGHGPQGDAFCALLDAEVNGQLAYAAEHGGAFPEDQRECVRAYLWARGRWPNGNPHPFTVPEVPNAVRFIPTDMLVG